MSTLLRLPVTDVTAAVAALFEDRGAPPEHGVLVAENLVAADRRGIHTHGIARVQMYVDAIHGQRIDPQAAPVVEYGAPAASCWDARRSFGQVTMAHVVDHACTRAQEAGAHIAVVHSSNHFGYAGHWALRAAERGLLGMSFTTGNPLVVPTGGVRPELGTNPLALALGSGDDAFVLDMSTSVVALGKLELAERAGESVRAGWAIDGGGAPLRQPSALLEDILGGEAGGLLPLGGGGTEHGGHKGYGLGAMVEILCAVLSGGADVTPGRGVDEHFGGNAAHCTLVVDPAHLAGVEPTQAALAGMLAGLRASPPLDADAPVLVAGDPEREWLARGGDDVFLEQATWAAVEALLQEPLR
ncbi:MAG TPA: Ldh family oxidoreductase [Conexibacter sp.]|jgi:L-2-hydroxycarboxylate dehydrogenase (NAD+)|nr:Ldh family oxidoreductase [Conexibacter sp.]